MLGTPAVWNKVTGQAEVDAVAARFLFVALVDDISKGPSKPHNNTGRKQQRGR
jgi:hypothetical protein